MTRGSDLSFCADMSSIPEHMVNIVASFLDQETYEDCRAYLIKNLSLIDRTIANGLFEDALYTFVEYPPAFGERMIRCSQIITYLCDIRQATNGQQDITLFFHRILNADPSFRKSFEDHCKMLSEKMQESAKRIKAKQQAQEKKEQVKKPNE